MNGMDGLRSKAPPKHVPFHLMSVASPMQVTNKTSRIKPVHVSGLLALNPGPIDKNNSKEVLPRPVRQKLVAQMRIFPNNVDEEPAQEALATAASTTASPMQVNATYKQVLGEKPVIDESFPPSDMSFSMKYTEQQAHGNTAMMDAAGASHIEEFSTGGKFTPFMAQTTPVEHPFVRAVQDMVAEKNVRNVTAPDGNQIIPMSQFINVVTGREINDKYGTNMVGKLLAAESDDKALLESFGIYKISNGRGSGTPALTFKGLKGLLCTNALKGVALAKQYIHYAADITTFVEAVDPSPNVYNAMARNSVAQEAASASPIIAAPPEQVVAARAVCFCCTCSDLGTALQVPVAQGATDVGFKRKADEDSQIYDWQNDERAFQVMVKQYEKNETIGTKLIKGAEAAVIKAKGVAESKVIAADADIKKAEAHAIRLNAAGKKRLDDAEASKIEADAQKIKAEAMMLHFELEQRRKSTGLDTNAKKSKAEEKKEERRLALNAKRRESRAQANAAKDKSPTPPQETA